MEFADKKSLENQAKKKRIAKNKVIEAQPPAEVPEKLKPKKNTQIEEASLVSVIAAEPTNSCSSDDSGIQVSMFDYSPEKHFIDMDKIYKLCGEAEVDLGGFDEGEIERLSSKVTFLSEWRYYKYKPKTIRFVPKSGLSNGKEAHNDITLSQFSAVLVPKSDLEEEHAVVSTDSRNDFVLYVGGLVWALDWCPRPEYGTHSDTKCEFIAVAAHPPDSTYHKLGEPLSGRGMIQIWCLINCRSSSVNLQAPSGKTKKKYKKKPVACKEDIPKRPRGRPRKNSIDKSPAFVSPEMQVSQALVKHPENMSDVLPVESNIVNTQKNSETNADAKKENKPKKPRARPGHISIDETLAVVGTEGRLTRALVVHPSGERTVSICLQNENKLSIPASQKEKRKKQKDVSSRTNAMDNAPAAMDTESQFSQALVVVTSEDTLNEPLVDKNLLTTPAPQKEEGKKQKAVKKRKNAMDKNPPNEGQFTQAIVVHTSNVSPMDENMLTTPAPKKEKRRKQKAATTRKNAVGEIDGAPDLEEPHFQALAVEFPENMANISPLQQDVLNTLASQEKNGKRQRVRTQKALNTDLECTISELRRRRTNGKSKVHNEPGHDNRLDQNEGEGPSLAGQQENYLEKDVNVLERDAPGDSVSNVATGSCNAPKNIVLPRVVLCLGHDGKVAWDVKWRPRNTSEFVNKHIMGHLAVALGNGSVEVWEIPSPQIIRCIYASKHADNVDPRFAKLKPVFRSAQLNYGDKQSVPLTVEWSASPPHNLILAGCHDGMVALWKFCADASSQDATPLLCFRAETDPIRALSWAPSEGDPDSAKVIVTAGHGGLKFWDLRDPFRPLWDANPSQRFIFSLDWLPDPRCVLVSYDDGTLRMVSLTRAAYDVPVTGEPFTGTLQQGVHSYCCSSFAIWSIHVSRLTGMVAYCCADGTVLYFQLTHKAVDKDPLRNRAPHFLCGSLVDEESVVAINTHLPTSPHLMKKSATEWANTPRPARTVASSLNQVKRVRKVTEKNQKADDEIIALSCDGGDANEAQISTPFEKGKSSKSKKANDDQELASIDENGRNVNGRSDMKEEVNGEFEDPPSKNVSMYKVRWNMNKGSEKWLCYGGAAGIVRCQEITVPAYDKKLLNRVPS